MARNTEAAAPRLSANEITNRLLLEIPKRFPARAWRRNVLAAIAEGRILRAGIPGQSDLTGFITIFGAAVHLEIEVKAGRDKLRPRQESWLKMISDQGGIAMVAHDVEQALEELEARVSEVERRISAACGGVRW